MKARFTQSFKIQAVEKVLERAEGVTVKDIANDLSVGHSTLGKFARQQKLEPIQGNDAPSMTNEKRPQDWKAEEKLNMVIACACLNEEKLSELCRKKGVFPHQVTQWKASFVAGQAAKITP